MMKLLKFAIFVLLAIGSSVIRGEEGGFDHERLTTVDGRTYHEVFIIGSDGNGLTFRHRKGIAKVGFTQLSEGYRMLYEAVAELPEAAPGGASAETAAEFAPETGSVGTPDGEPVILRARNRTVIELPAAWQRLGGGVDLQWLASAWPVWWPDHSRVHRITQPLYRELVVREFLHTSGLLPWPLVR
jgi:hypothetical protein